MKIFKELKKLGYIHYSATTIEELDDLPLNSAERISEQALVLRWFREKYGYYVDLFVDDDKTFGFMISYFVEIGRADKPIQRKCNTYEEAELECLKKLIEIVKNNNK
jgi:hypothetical protein